MSLIKLLPDNLQLPFFGGSLNLTFIRPYPMNTILVPTDFSGTADNAFHFALILAKKNMAKLILLHAYQLPVAAGAVSFNVLGEEKEVIEQEATKKMKALCLQIEHTIGIDYEYFIEEGDTIDTILKVCKELKPGLIIMGTQGASSVAGIIFGSNTSKVISKAPCPVMAIPEGSKFTNTIKKITFATDYHQSDIEAIHTLIEMTSAFNPQINILHISGDEIDTEQEVKLMDTFRKKVNQSCFYNNLSFQIIHGRSVEEEFENYLANDSTNVLVMATHFRSFMDRIFGKSLTKQLVGEITIPLIAFHYK